MHKAMFIEILRGYDGHAWSRRRVLRAGGLALMAMASGHATKVAAREALLPTPQCDDGKATSTPRQTEGPFYTPKTPKRASLIEPGQKGEPIIVVGTVLSTRCQPLAGAWLDFWQADADGAYDNQGFTLRGHQFADANGQYRLETMLPGLYPGRTRHIHVKVRAKTMRGRELTTQLYFPDEADNRRDSIYDERLVVARQPSSGKKPVMRFDFVLKA